MDEVLAMAEADMRAEGLAALEELRAISHRVMHKRMAKHTLIAGKDDDVDEFNELIDIVAAYRKAGVLSRQEVRPLLEF